MDPRVKPGGDEEGKRPAQSMDHAVSRAVEPDNRVTGTGMTKEDLSALFVFLALPSVRNFFKVK